MGQQQLLLVILVTIIVGIATVVAINTFSTSAEQANLDAVRQDIAAITSSAQAWYIRPAMLEGGGNSYANLNFDRLNFAYDTRVSATEVSNPNGSYVLSDFSADGFTITATPNSNSDVTITGTFDRTATQNLTVETTNANDEE